MCSFPVLFSREEDEEEKKKRNEDAKDDVEKKIEESDPNESFDDAWRKESARFFMCDVFARKVMHFPP